MLKWIAFILGAVAGVLLMLSFIYLLSVNWLFAIVLIGAVGYCFQRWVMPYIEGEQDVETFE